MSFFEGFEKTAGMKSFVKKHRGDLTIGAGAVAGVTAGLYYNRHKAKAVAAKYDKKMGEGAHKKFDPSNKAHLKALLKAQGIKAK